MRKITAFAEAAENLATSLDNIDLFRKPSTERDGVLNFNENIEILKKISFERTPHDLKVIATILKQFGYFSKLVSPRNENKLFELAKTIRHEYFHRDAVIFHKEDINDRIYLVLEGSAFIFHQIALDVFKSQISLADDPSQQNAEEKYELGQQPTQFSPYSMRVKQLKRQTTLFQPRMSRKKVMRLTTFSDSPFLRDSRPSSTIPTTPEEKNIVPIILRHSPTGNSTFAPHAANSETVSPTPEFLDPNLMDKKKLALYKLLQRADKERPGKYLMDSKMLFEMREKVEKGSHFGEMTSKTNRAKDVTAMASKGSHFISFSVRDYAKLFDQSPIKKSFAEFYRPYFPETSHDKLVKIANLFEECHYRRNNVVYEEDTEVDGLYIIKEGQVQLQKRVDFEKLVDESDEPLSPTFKRGYCIASLGPREIFGEDELLYKERFRHHTVTVTSTNATLLKLKAEVYLKMNKTFKELFQAMKKTARAKKNFYSEQSDNTIQQLTHSIQQNETLKISLKDEVLVKKERFEETPKEWNFRILDDKKIGLYSYFLKKKEEETNSSHSRSPQGNSNKKLNSWLGLVQKSVVSAQKGMVDLGLGMRPPSQKPRSTVTSPKVNRIVARSPNHSEMKVVQNWSEAVERQKTPVLERPATTASNKKLVPFFKSLESEIQTYIGSPLVDEKSSLYRKARGYVKRGNLQSNPINTKISSIGLDPQEMNTREMKKLLQRLAKPKDNQQTAEEQLIESKSTKNIHLHLRSTDSLPHRPMTSISTKQRWSKRSRLDSNLSNSNILEQTLLNTSKKGLTSPTPILFEKRPETALTLETFISEGQSLKKFNNIHISAALFEKGQSGLTAKGGGFRSNHVTLKRTNRVESSLRNNKSNISEQSNFIDTSFLQNKSIINTRKI